VCLDQSDVSNVDQFVNYKPWQRRTLPSRILSTTLPDQGNTRHYRRELPAHAERPFSTRNRFRYVSARNVAVAGETSRTTHEIHSAGSGNPSLALADPLRRDRHGMLSVVDSTSITYQF